MQELSPQEWDKLNVSAPRYEIDIILNGRKKAAIFQRLTDDTPAFAREVWVISELIPDEHFSNKYKGQGAVIICGYLFFQSDPEFNGQGYNYAEFKTKEQAFMALQKYVLSKGGQIIINTEK
jgi:hypothetical protein